MSEKLSKSDGKISISKLSREYKVSRQALYKLFAKNGWDKKNITDAILNALDKQYASHHSKRKEDGNKIRKASKTSAKSKKEDFSISKSKISTAEQRLSNKRQEYNYNRNLITILQDEIDEIKNVNGTTMQNHTGTQTSIPQLPQLEKYLSLNLKIDKQIQELEVFLGYESDEDDNPFDE